jgi:hypothetical protein
MVKNSSMIIPENAAKSKRGSDGYDEKEKYRSRRLHRL